MSKFHEVKNYLAVAVAIVGSVYLGWFAVRLQVSLYYGWHKREIPTLNSAEVARGYLMTREGHHNSHIGIKSDSGVVWLTCNNAPGGFDNCLPHSDLKTKSLAGRRAKAYWYQPHYLLWFNENKRLIQLEVGKKIVVSRNDTTEENVLDSGSNKALFWFMLVGYVLLIWFYSRRSITRLFKKVTSKAASNSES